MLQIVAGALFSFHRWIAGWYEGALGIKETFLCLSIWDFQSLEKEMSVIDDSMVETKTSVRSLFHRQWGRLWKKAFVVYEQSL